MQYRLYAFGSNGEGQLGLGHVLDKVTKPERVRTRLPLDSIRNITGGAGHTLFLTDTGSVWAAGSNMNLQMGAPDDDEVAPGCILQLKEKHRTVDFCAAAIKSTAIIRNTPTEACLYTAGEGRWGELANGEQRVSSKAHPDVQHSPGPQVMSFHSPVIDLAAGTWHCVAVLENGEVWGWGKNRSRQLSDIPEKIIDKPICLDNLGFHPVRAVCGHEFTFVAGHSSSGQHSLLGENKYLKKANLPQDIKGWKDIGATWHAIFILFDNGKLQAWGKEDRWRLIPPNLPSIGKMAVGTDHILCLTTSGKLISWGWAYHGNCGDTETSGIKLINGCTSNGTWNEITDIPGKVYHIGAGSCTSFVVTSMDEDDDLEEDDSHEER